MSQTSISITTGWTPKFSFKRVKLREGNKKVNVVPHLQAKDKHMGMIYSIVKVLEARCRLQLAKLDPQKCYTLKLSTQHLLDNLVVKSDDGVMRMQDIIPHLAETGIGMKEFYPHNNNIKRRTPAAYKGPLVKISSCRFFRPRELLQDQSCINEIIQDIFENGPVIGAFPSRSDFDERGKQKIYWGKGRFCFDNATKLIKGFCVVITGISWVNEQVICEYTGNWGNKFGRRGYSKVAFSALEYIVIPDPIFQS